MVEDNFVHTDVRTVLYPDNHLEYQCLQPAPVVRLESNRLPSYGAAAHRPSPAAVATSAVPGASTSASTPLTTTSTTVSNRCRLNQQCMESWTGLGTPQIKNTHVNQSPVGFYDINEGRHAQLKPTVVTSGIARSAVKISCTTNFLAVKSKLTGVSLWFLVNVFSKITLKTAGGPLKQKKKNRKKQIIFNKVLVIFQMTFFNVFLRDFDAILKYLPKNKILKRNMWIWNILTNSKRNINGI